MGVTEAQGPLAPTGGNDTVSVKSGCGLRVSDECLNPKLQVVPLPPTGHCQPEGASVHHPQ